jgi:KUP system potassium uptake protein
MATVRIADAIRPTRSNDGSNSALSGGVYPIRAVSLERRTSHRASEHEKLDDDDEEGGLRQDGDFKKRQVCAD